MVRAVFGYAEKRVFKKADFAVSTEGVVRLTNDTAREIAEVVIGKFPVMGYMNAVKVVETKL